MDNSVERGTPRNVISTLNSTTTPLGSGGVFQGVSENVSMYGRAGISVWTPFGEPTDGVLTVEVSRDGVNWGGPDRTFANTAIAEPHMWNIVEKYFRIKYTNGTTVPTEFELQVQYSVNADILLGHQLDATLLDETEAVITRSLIVGKEPSGAYQNVTLNEVDNLMTSDFLTEVAKGNVTNHALVRKFGTNAAIGSSETFIGVVGGTTPYMPSTAVTVEAISSDTNDTSAGTGAQQITITGVDNSWNEVSEVITMNGTSATSATSASFFRVYRAVVNRTGTYRGNNAGTITVRASGAGTSFASISIGRGQSQLSNYTVPAGKTLYVTQINFQIDALKAVELTFWQAPAANDVTTAFGGAKRLIKDFPGLTGNSAIPFAPPIRIEEYTDIWWSGTASGGGGGAGVGYSGLLVTT